jgi:hypothetical protein
MTSKALHISLVGATALAALVAASPAGAAYEHAYGARHHVTHSRIHRRHYWSGPAGVVRGAGAAADEAAGGLFAVGVGGWDALDCVTFGYYCRR